MHTKNNVKNKAIVASGHEAVSRAAALILEAGGNAFDAVVAAGFAGTVTEQMLTSLGGGGFVLARTADQEEIFFDFFVNRTHVNRTANNYGFKTI